MHDSSRDFPAATYARQALGAAAEVARRPDQDPTVWQVVLLLDVLGVLDRDGLGGRVRAAVDQVARWHDVDARQVVAERAGVVPLPDGVRA